VTDSYSASRKGLTLLFAGAEGKRLPEATEHPLEPLVSVIMPVRNEESAIQSSLGSVLAQRYPRERMEVIVVDGMSTDRTREIVLQLAKYDERVRLLENPRKIMAIGFNKGLSAARGSIILMLGGHTELSSNYVHACSTVLQQGLADCAGAPIDTVSGGQGEDAVRAALTCSFGVGSPAFRGQCSEPKYVDTVAFGAYTREIIDRVGALDEELVRNQDDEFNYRIRKLGGRILLIPDASSRYVARSSLRLLRKQYFQYGLWKVRVLQKHPYQMQPRHFVPALFVFTLLSSALLSPFLGLARAGLVIVTLLYVVANLSVSAIVTRKARRWKLLPSLPIVFATLHFAYGIGFLAGLIRFCNKFGADPTPVQLTKDP
jgi:succinoglycan biosynthesis protein ExoA